jgi:hypothetical protein
VARLSKVFFIEPFLWVIGQIGRLFADIKQCSEVYVPRTFLNR